MERTQINKIRDENGKINNGHHRNTKDHKRLLQATVYQQNGQPGRNVQKGTTFQDWTRKKIEYINRPITSSEVESVIKNLPTNKSPGLDDFIMNSTKYLLIGKN